MTARLILRAEHGRRSLINSPSSASPGASLGPTLLGHELLELIDHALEIWKAGAEEHAGDHIPAARGDRTVVRYHVKLTGLAGLDDGVDVEALLDEGDETRRLDPGAVSRGARTDLDLHIISSRTG
jgi:hypothetical protein